MLHIVVEQGSHCGTGNLDRVMRQWTGLLGQPALRLADDACPPEAIVSAMQVNEGRSLDDVTARGQRRKRGRASR